MHTPRSISQILSVLAALGACGESGGSDAESGGSGETSGETGGPTCDEPDPQTNAAFDIDLGDWMIIQPSNYYVELQVDCVVTSVTFQAGRLRTDLDCMDDENVSHAVGLSIADDGERAPTWAVDDAVKLRIDAATDGGGGLDPLGARSAEFPFLAVGLARAADGAALIVAVDDSGVPASFLEPLTFEVVDRDVCGMVEPCSSDPDLPLRFAISEPGNETLTLLGGQRGTLPLSDGTTLVVDAGVADALSDCHFGSWFVLLARRFE